MEEGREWGHGEREGVIERGHIGKEDWCEGNNGGW